MPTALLNGRYATGLGYIFLFRWKSFNKFTVNQMINNETKIDVIVYFGNHYYL